MGGGGGIHSLLPKKQGEMANHLCKRITTFTMLETH